MGGLEPPRLSPPDPKSGAATNYATPANFEGAKVHFFSTRASWLLAFGVWLLAVGCETVQRRSQMTVSPSLVKEGATSTMRGPRSRRTASFRAVPRL